VGHVSSNTGSGYLFAKKVQLCSTCIANGRFYTSCQTDIANSHWKKQWVQVTRHCMYKRPYIHHY